MGFLVENQLSSELVSSETSIILECQVKLKLDHKNTLQTFVPAII